MSVPRAQPAPPGQPLLFTHVSAANGRVRFIIHGPFSVATSFHRGNTALTCEGGILPQFRFCLFFFSVLRVNEKLRPADDVEEDKRGMAEDGA